MIKTVLVAVAIAAAFLFAPMIAIAQNEPETMIPPTSFLFDAWTIVQPVAVFLSSTVGPAIAVWISVKVIALLGITSEVKRAEVEAQFREALHLSALRGLKFAFAKLGLPPVALSASSAAIGDAISYIKEKNPDAIDAFGLTDKALREIVLSKVPDVNAVVAASKQLPQTPPIGGTAAPL